MSEDFDAPAGSAQSAKLKSILAFLDEVESSTDARLHRSGKPDEPALVMLSEPSPRSTVLSSNSANEESSFTRRRSQWVWDEWDIDASAVSSTAQAAAPRRSSEPVAAAAAASTAAAAASANGREARNAARGHYAAAEAAAAQRLSSTPADDSSLAKAEEMRSELRQRRALITELQVSFALLLSGPSLLTLLC
jgi:trimeric autotransporter adhesin